MKAKTTELETLIAFVTKTIKTQAILEDEYKNFYSAPLHMQFLAYFLYDSGNKKKSKNEIYVLKQALNECANSLTDSELSRLKDVSSDAYKTAKSLQPKQEKGYRFSSVQAILSNRSSFTVPESLIANVKVRELALKNYDDFKLLFSEPNRFCQQITLKEFANMMCEHKNRLVFGLTKDKVVSEITSMLANMGKTLVDLFNDESAKAIFQRKGTRFLGLDPKLELAKVNEPKPHQILGVNEDATVAEIKAAFHKAALLHHPDRGGDEEKFKAAQNARDSMLKAIEKKKANQPLTPGI